jgi:hypothetical protein
MPETIEIMIPSFFALFGFFLVFLLLAAIAGALLDKPED